MSQPTRKAITAPLISWRAGTASGSSSGRGTCPNRHTPGAAFGRGVRSQARNAEPSGRGGAPGGAVGIGGTAGPSGGAAGRGTGFARVPRASCVPSLSIACAP
ncbi:hypothetical protein GCM10018783_30780 [Streptomyces griseosporeus]|nr:hypothetical protein GCM10018783_30780 [Streptomyces griseosporeus]